MRLMNDETEQEVFYGACRFCGQTMNVTEYVDPDATEDQMDRAATEHCRCARAIEFNSIRSSINRANDLIEEMIADDEMKSALSILVSPLCNGNITKVSIDDGMGKKYAMSLKKGLVEIKISETVVKTRS